MLGMGSGDKPPAPPLVEPIAVADTIANGVSIFDDSLLTWLTFWVERAAAQGERPERVVTSRICVPSAQYPRLLRMLSLPVVVHHESEGNGHGAH